MSPRTASLPDGAAAAMAPVREAIAAEAARRADALRARADERCADLEGGARAESARIIAGATADGRAAGDIVARDRTARSRREAAELVLAHREAARREMQDAVRAGAAALVSDDRYPEILRRLVARGRALLGPDAEITELPDGGIVVTAGSRRLDLSLAALADAAWRRSEGEVERVWTG